MDDLREENHHCTRPGSGDGRTLLIAMHSNDVHGTRASAVVAKSELLSMRTKDFQNNIHDVHKSLLEKEREIDFRGKDNPDVLFSYSKLASRAQHRNSER